jgi:hypothetical protein
MPVLRGRDPASKEGLSFVGEAFSLDHRGWKAASKEEKSKTATLSTAPNKVGSQSVGAASCRDSIVAGSHAHKEKTFLR